MKWKGDSYIMVARTNTTWERTTEVSFGDGPSVADRCCSDC